MVGDGCPAACFDRLGFVILDDDDDDELPSDLSGALSPMAMLAGIYK